MDKNWEYFIDWCEKHPYTTFSTLEIRDGKPVVGKHVIPFTEVTTAYVSVLFNEKMLKKT